MGSIKDESERAAFSALSTPLVDAAEPYTKSRAVSAPGAERVLSGFLDILREWITVERCFCDGVAYADAVDSLRKANKGNAAGVLQMCRSHALLNSTATVILRIIDSIAEAGKTDINAPSSINQILKIKVLLLYPIFKQICNKFMCYFVYT